MRIFHTVPLRDPAADLRDRAARLVAVAELAISTARALELAAALLETHEPTRVLELIRELHREAKNEDRRRGLLCAETALEEIATEYRRDVQAAAEQILRALQGVKP